ncbi:MAG: MarC family protein, partial [Sphaerospermopsis kisseleviana]
MNKQHSSYLSQSSLSQSLTGRNMRKYRWINTAGILILLIGINLIQPGIAAVPPSCTVDEQFACMDRQTALVAQAPAASPLPAATATIPKQRLADQIAKTPLSSPVGILNLFIIFFVTLGPLKTIPSFVQLTQNADAKLRRQLAFRSTAIATIVILLVAIIGQNMLRVWQVRLPALLIGGGILLFLIALRIVLSEYSLPEKAVHPDEPSLKMAVTPLAFPTILPPFGIAIALTIMVMSTYLGISQFIVLGLLVLVMLLNLIGMLAA